MNTKEANLKTEKTLDELRDELDRARFQLELAERRTELNRWREERAKWQKRIDDIENEIKGRSDGGGDEG